MKKIVNGKEITCSADEEIKINNEWDSNKLTQENNERLYGYLRKREAEMPNVTEVMHVIMRQLCYQKKSTPSTICAEMNELIENYEIVNAKYPKP